MLQELFTYPFLIRILNKIFNDNDKLNVINLNKYFNNKRTKFTYDTKIKIKRKIKNLWYYNCLTNVVVYDLITLPEKVTSLKFGKYFNKSVKNYIPNSVKYLSFGYNFDQNVEKCIPDSVTHLNFGYWFCQKIYNLPFVTHLIYCVYYFGQEINFSPSLKYFCAFDFIIDLNKEKIPSSVIVEPYNKKWGWFVEDCEKKRSFFGPYNDKRGWLI